jgi:DNA-binding transcriptional LysR family regulator
MDPFRRIDLNLLVALHALLEERSVTGAARRLALTQPTVSAMLTRLRKQFDDPLFVRTQRGILPTPRAQALAPVLRNWLNDAQALVAKDRFDPSVAKLTVSLSANDYIQATLVVPFIKKLRSQAPQMRLAIRNPQFSNIIGALTEGELDLCVTTAREVSSADLYSRTLYEERYVGVVRKAHPLKANVTLDQFCRYPHVVVSPTEGRFLGPTDQALAAVGRRRSVLLSAPGFLVVPEILQTDDLIAVLPERVLCGRMNGLRTFNPPVPVPGFSVLLLWHKRVHKDPALQWMRELLASTASALRSTRLASKG